MLSLRIDICMAPFDVPFGKTKQLNFQPAIAFIFFAQVVPSILARYFFQGPPSNVTGTKNFQDRSAGAMLY
jgi:hypothetical protein